MNIMLGIYGTQFHKIAKLTKSFPYPFSLVISENSKDTVTDHAEIAMKLADRINFLLDGVRFPLDACLSFTCSELEVLLNNEAYFEKTDFWLRDTILTDEALFRYLCLQLQYK